MNEEIKPVPEPTVQPVSMHDTPHQHHGALPLIAAMLGVFLVLETIALGYVVTKYVLNEEVAEPVEEEVSTEVVEEVEEERTGEDTLLSHLVLDGEPRDVEGIAGSTWLQTRVSAEADDSPCEGVYELVEADQRSGMGVAAAGLSDPDVSALFSNRVGVTGVDILESVLENQNQILYQVCTTSSRDLVILMDEGTNGVATLAEFDDQHNYWNLFQPVRGVMDGAVWLLPDFFGDVPLLVTGYGDAGYLWWSYWVPTEYETLQLIEHCTNAPKYPEDGVSEPDPTRLLTCEVEYVK